MQVLRLLIVGLTVIVLMAACATSPDKERGRVHCPACDSEFDALFQTNF